MSILSAAVLLFLVMDPLGNIPMFMVALANVEPALRKRVVIRELLIALVVLVVFLLGGQYILQVFHISKPSLSIAGGIILFLIALKMIFRGQESMFGDAADAEPFIVPLAVPALAGPSAMATVILLVTREPTRLVDWLLAVGIAWSAAAAILLFAGELSRILGNRGLAAAQRLMGMLLTAVAVQMLLTGIREFLIMGSG
jgi:multiple antibiotic resistance protein